MIRKILFFTKRTLVSSFISKGKLVTELRLITSNLEKSVNGLYNHILENSYKFVEQEYFFLRLSDLSKLLVSQKYVNWRVETNNPVALDSNDHNHPRGVRNDETRSPAFVANIASLFDSQISYLDLGCAGGGLVYDFILEGHLAVGIEGSDFAQRHRRAYWREIPWALHTADLTKDLQIYLDSERAKFDVIGAWEFFEHISESDINFVLKNVKRHLKSESGLFLANIATFKDHEGNVHWHQTVREESWWVEKLTSAGFQIVHYPFSTEFNPRGSGNVLGTWKGDYDIKTNPHLGFSIAAKFSDT